MWLDPEPTILLINAPVPRQAQKQIGTMSIMIQMIIQRTLRQIGCFDMKYKQLIILAIAIIIIALVVFGTSYIRNASSQWNLSRYPKNYDNLLSAFESSQNVNLKEKDIELLLGLIFRRGEEGQRALNLLVNNAQTDNVIEILKRLSNSIGDDNPLGVAAIFTLYRIGYNKDEMLRLLVSSDVINGKLKLYVINILELQFNKNEDKEYIGILEPLLTSEDEYVRSHMEEILRRFVQ
jgi:hypothetical protein